MKTIYWAGESTVEQSPMLTFPQTGVGQLFHRFVKPDVRILSYEEKECGTKRFLDAGRLAAIYDPMEPGDFLFVQFGQGDGMADDPSRYTDPEGEFADNLERFVNAARNKGGLPVFITPLSFAAYAASLRRRAQRLSVPVVDLGKHTEEAREDAPLHHGDAALLCRRISDGLQALGGVYAELLANDEAKPSGGERVHE